MTQTQLQQLLSYCENCQREGWYYGNKRQFENRHAKIKAKIEAVMYGTDGDEESR